jgi:hypothetical protein
LLKQGVVIVFTDNIEGKEKNRIAFIKAVLYWYQKNKSTIDWVMSNKVLTCDCSFDHPNGGHFELVK